MEENDQELKKRLDELENENNFLKGELEATQQTCVDICTSLNDMMKFVAQLEERVRQNSKNGNVLYNRIRNLPYEIFDPRFPNKYIIPKIMTEEETIDEIVINHKSIARFGDGEFGIMFGDSRWRFQRTDDKLAERLREVVTSDDDSILIGLNNFYGDLSHRVESDADGIRSYITPEIRAQHMELLRFDRVYAHACISRSGSLEKVRNQQRIWDKKNCVFIEGDKTRMGVGNDLFHNAASIQRILCPAENAFDRYDDILTEALKMPKETMMLIALGPTASVLAYDLAKAGYHAVDIGHADLAYEWLLRNEGKKTAVPNKYNNEWPEGYIVEDIYDEKYYSEIIADCSEVR